MVYAGTWSSGTYKTADGGYKWQLLDITACGQRKWDNAGRLINGHSEGHG